VELRHLEYFVAVADERSFTRAAEQLHVVQSGVSSGVKALERELGTALLERTSRRVTLTSAGTALLPKARSALDAARDARDAVDAVRGGLRGVLPSSPQVPAPSPPPRRHSSSNSPNGSAEQVIGGFARISIERRFRNAEAAS
jgi:DNA-binding transcriptional LysR family regulator